jgi:nucleoside-diphosphate-sugar epimerase
VIGTQIVIEAAILNGVSALVYTGSTAGRMDAFSPKNAEFRNEIDENGENNIFQRNIEDLCSFYGKTKNMAERAVISANGRNGIRTASVMPCVVFGYKDRFQMDSHFPSNLQHKPMTGVLRVQEDEKGLVAWSFNESCNF